MIWLTEAAPQTAAGRAIMDNSSRLKARARLAAKMATVMALLIAWQAVNAARRHRRFSDAFLVICPEITIRDRLRVLLPSDPNDYYRSRNELSPGAGRRPRGAARRPR